MPIIVANTWREELEALTAQQVALARSHGASRWESEAFDLLGFRVSVRIVRRAVRGRKEALVREFYLNGRRKGYNALLYALMREERRLLSHATRT